MKLDLWGFWVICALVGWCFGDFIFVCVGLYRLEEYWSSVLFVFIFLPYMVWRLYRDFIDIFKPFDGVEGA